DEMWDVLVAGVQISELVARLRERRPRARDIARPLTVFLNRLWNAGLLEGSTPTAAPSSRLIEIPIDRLARPCGLLPRRLPTRLWATVIVAGAGASGWGLAMLLASAGRPRLSQLTEPLSISSVLVVVLVMVPLHELGPAVACRLAGVASGPAGIRFGLLGLPRPYVDTALPWGIEEARRRWWIPAGGPLGDLMLGGAAAWTLLFVDPAAVVESIVWLAGLYALIAVDVGTSPIPVGDGSHLLEALLDDEFARRAALR